MEERTLSAALKFYCGKSLENAHSAEADTMATYEILKAQLDRYPELENDMKVLSEFTTRKKIADFAGMIAFDKDNEEIFTFGKHKGAKVEKVKPASIVDKEQFVNLAKRKANEQSSGNGIFADQFENEENWKCHYNTTGPEIYRQCAGKLDVFVSGVGISF